MRANSSRKRKVDDAASAPPGENTVEAVFERAHEEVTKIRNIDCVQMGAFEIPAWYYSPYPDQYHTARKLFVCEYCLKYMRHPQSLARHAIECELRHPPGNEIYRHRGLSVFEVDAKQNTIYCQNLCLFSKLFLGMFLLCLSLKRGGLSKSRSVRN